MEQKKSYEIDMCNGPILSKMLLFTIPLMCSSMLQLLFNAADIVVVGRYAGDNSLAAVGSNTSLIGLLTNLFLGLSIGANVLVARYYGAKREEELKQTVHTAILLSIYSGIILTVLGLFWCKTDFDMDADTKRGAAFSGTLSADLFSGNDGNHGLQFWQCDPACSGRH